MPRKISCDCGATYNLADAFTGTAVKCKKCSATIRVAPEPEVDEVESLDEPEPVAAAPRSAKRDGKVNSAEIGPVKVRSRRERSMEKGPPFYTQPMFFVAVGASAVCGYFALSLW